MIGQLKGIILEKQPPELLLDVSGIGYQLDAPMSTFYQLPDIGEMVTLFTHLIVREDAHHLYAFYQRDERTLFKQLIKVNGVGPRLALTILSSIAVNEFVNLILEQNLMKLVQIPGIGRKTADRLIMEMRDKLNDWCMPMPHETTSSRQQIIQDAVSAMVALGYKGAEAKKLVSKLDDGQLSSEALIRQALKEFAPC